MFIYLFIYFFAYFSQCRVLMSNISEDMVDEDLNNVKFLLSSRIPREKIDKAKVKHMERL